jgi:hypothetical protein
MARSAILSEDRRQTEPGSATEIEIAARSHDLQPAQTDRSGSVEVEQVGDRP